MTVYALCSSSQPTVIRYIGATTESLENRLALHLSLISKSPCRNWIAKLKEKGKTVVIKALGHYSSIEEMANAEQAWIRFHESRGRKLLNVRKQVAKPGCFKRGYTLKPREKGDLKWESMRFCMLHILPHLIAYSLSHSNTVSQDTCTKMRQ